MYGSWEGSNITAQVTGRGRIDVRVTDTDDQLLWKDDQPATDKGIRSIAAQLDGVRAIRTDASVLEVISKLTYGILNSISDGGVAENLLTRPDTDEEPMLVSPLVVSEGASAVIGPSGSTKSINAVAVGLARSSGLPIGVHQPTGERNPVLILDGEANRRDLYEIAAAIGRAHRIDIEALEREGLFRYRRISAPILGTGEQLRREVDKDGYKLLIVDSVDTARGSDAVNRSGEYYDTLRHADVPSLSIDHVTAEMALRPMLEYRAMASIKSTNRPRQTWAMKATQKSGSSLVTVRYRLNFANRGQVGTEFTSVLEFEMDGGRFHRITLGERTAVERKEPAQYERVLIALSESDPDPSYVQLQDLTDLTQQQVTKAIQTARQKSMATETGKPLTLTASGENHLITEWPDEMPDPNMKGVD
jgi:hypothetical protein